MKKKLAFLLLLCCALLPLTSCGGDDDNDPTVASDVVGTYNGPMGIVVNGVSTGASSNYDIAITQTSDGTVKLGISNFTFGTSNFGNLSIGDCKCTYSNGKFVLDGTTTVTVNLAGVSIPCPVTVSGNITNNVATLTLNIIAGTQTVVVSYTGTRK